MECGTFPVIMNPTAGGGRLLRWRDRLEETARIHGVELEWWFTEHRGHGEQLARQAAEQGATLVFAFGGDGSYNEVARGLTGSACAMGVLPGGTASVLVTELGIPRPATRALVALLAGRDRSMHVGRTSAGETILLMLSAGPDAVVLERLMPMVKKIGGRYGIAAQALAELAFGRRMPTIRVTVEGRVIEGGWVVIGNARCYGGPFRATPGADPFTPGFEVVVLRRTGRLAIIAFALDLARNRHLRRDDVDRFHATTVRVEAAPAFGAARYQIDGDLSGELPVEVSVDSETVLLRVPGELL